MDVYFMRMCHKTLFLALITAFVIGELKFKNCPLRLMGPTNGSDLVVQHLKIEGCQVMPCTLIIGKSYAFEMKFKLNYITKRVRASMYVIPNNTSPQVMCDNVDICDYLHIDEPCEELYPGKELTARVIMTTSDFGVPNTYTFTTIFTEDTGYIPLFCGELTVVLKSEKATNATNFDRNIKKWLHKSKY